MHRALPTNAYHLLSIQPNATTSQIKGAYLKLVMVWHPDKNDDPKAPAKFKEVQVREGRAGGGRDERF